MLRKRVAVVIISFLFAISLFSEIQIGKCWSPPIITTNLGSSPNMNGILDSSWKSVSVVNVTSDTIPNNGRILLYAKYNQSALFFFAELQFATKFQNETLSLYLSNSNTTVGAVYTDARQITIYNATQYGNDSYNEQALYKNS